MCLTVPILKMAEHGTVKLPHSFVFFMFRFQLDYTRYFYISIRKKIYRKIVKA